jgi:hypothetical protein
VGERDEFAVGVDVRGAPLGEECPVVVVVFVVIAGDLLLLRACWEGLDVRVEEATAVADVFEGDFGAEHDFCWGVNTRSKVGQGCVPSGF